MSTEPTWPRSTGRTTPAPETRAPAADAEVPATTATVPARVGEETPAPDAGAGHPSSAGPLLSARGSVVSLLPRWLLAVFVGFNVEGLLEFLLDVHAGQWEVKALAHGSAMALAVWIAFARRRPTLREFATITGTVMLLSFIVRAALRR